MKILHIIKNCSTDLSRQIIDVHSKNYEVKVIDLSKKDVSYETIVDDIFSHERVISW
jgi:hypothetical protein